MQIRAREHFDGIYRITTMDDIRAILNSKGTFPKWFKPCAVSPSYSRCQGTSFGPTSDRRLRSYQAARYEFLFLCGIHFNAIFSFSLPLILLYMHGESRAAFVREVWMNKKSSVVSKPPSFPLGEKLNGCPFCLRASLQFMRKNHKMLSCT